VPSPISPRILVENGSHGMHNVGDIAMLQVAVRRLRARFPKHRIEVVTGHSPRLRAEVPEAHPVCSRGGWLAAFGVPDPPMLDAMAARHPVVGHVLDKLGGRIGHPERLGRSPSAFGRKLENTALVVASGGGYIADDFAEWTAPVLENLAAAQARGIPTALLGQGLGPVAKGTPFHSLASTTVAGAHHVFVREEAVAPALLAEWGLPQERVRFTGDDALADAARHRRDGIGDALGVNVRAARYTGIDQSALNTIGRVAGRLASRHGAPIVGIPISRVSVESDHDVLRGILEDHPGFDHSDPPTTAQATMATAARCRVVLATSYHAVVFALACGIPSVCIVATPYYGAKMGGLADQFGPACRTVSADDDRFAEQLEDAIETAWTEADALRDSARAAADRRIADAEAAYDLLISTVG